MVIRFQFAVLTKRNGEGNEVSHLTVCVWRDGEGRGLSMHSLHFSVALSASHALIHRVMLFIVGIAVHLCISEVLPTHYCNGDRT